MIELTEKPIRQEKVHKRLASKESGSVVVHYGVVKKVVDGKRTAGIRFSPDGDLEGELRELEKKVRGKWNIEDMVLIRRLGELRTGDIILAAAVSAEGRDDAFGACRDVVDGCKKLKCIKKTELYEE